MQMKWSGDKAGIPGGEGEAGGPGRGAEGEISKSVLTKCGICVILFYMQIPAQGPLAQLVRAPGS